ncbi:heat shock 70 kDa protein 12B-like isoform X2 [Mizuhopecten yessoensis]|uniref:heat shock 70 kDa protein 12B-like isoform X2 n=1 Tax=Mizuhopecten yessoensis TaxID=6573 RepID=UPI000B45E399|nr:heat shock 70 kDa protein 12B-like isoform X2 [Mizuhopecten yessoensis]
MKEKMTSKHEVVVAIDFGTTYSGYAFSTTSEYQKDPTKISANSAWIAASAGLLSLKCPTCILFDKDQKFVNFGYEAEDKYANLALDNMHHEYYFFKQFKMSLHKNKDLNRDTLIEDESGKSMKAKTVFASGIRFLKNHAEELINTRGMSFEEWEIRWVVTVPAIWSDAAKQFMREAAQKAEIMNDQLLIALEPEAASVCCRHLPDAKGSDIFMPGSKYMVLDLGGGTADINVHQVVEDGSLRELHKASGGAWGGTRVDASFIRLLCAIVGDDVMEAFRREHPADYIDLLREFEVKKRNVKETMESSVNFRLPLALTELFETKKKMTFREALADSTYSDDVTPIADKIRIKPNLIQGMFRDPLVHLEDHIRCILAKPEVRGTSTLLLVGGFSESPIVQETMKRKFPRVKIVVPAECGLAVLKGAVIFGHEPKNISARVAKFTYGIAISKPFIEGHHPIEKKKVTQNGVICTDVFHKYVECGESMDVDNSQTLSFSAAKGCSSNRVRVYRSTASDPMFVTDDGCCLLGEVILTRNTDLNLSQKIDVSLTFGGTECSVVANDSQSGESFRSKFDFLNA